MRRRFYTLPAREPTSRGVTPSGQLKSNAWFGLPGCCFGARVVWKAIQDSKKRGSIAENIKNKAGEGKGLILQVMSRPNYVNIPPGHRAPLEECYREILKIETQAKACADDNSKPLPDDAKSVAEVSAKIKEAKKHIGLVTKVLAVLDRAPAAS